MMDRSGLFPLVLLTVLASRIAAYDYSQYDLSSMCGGGLLFSNMGAIIVKLDTSGLRPNINCSVSYSTGRHRRITVRFSSMNLPGNFDCWENKVDLYDGKLLPQNRMTGPNGLCGYDVDRTYTTTGERIYIQFRSHVGYEGRGFTIYLTDFYSNGPCRTGEFQCDNGWCIDGFLRCDGWDNCEDRSDESASRGCDLHYLFTPWVIAVLSLLGLLFLGICLALITVVSRRVSRRSSYTQIKH
ncbi:suppressor of tumorigenicity 14 protein homolog [Liolophura sinensis]|uniref:suppressor of tumorigenicity 14 protein homolog n=1 Tax=Liolophura sinensis TaxID=3198878 RepID=UPI00315919AD